MTQVADIKTNKILKETSWFQEYKDAYQANAAWMFGLSGDVYGTTVDGYSQVSYLSLMSSRRNIIFTYNREAGFRFVEPSHRVLANDILGELPEQGNELLAAAEQARKGPADQGEGWFTRPEKVIDGLRLIEKLLLADSDERKPKTTHPKSAFDRVAVIIEQAELICPDREKATMSDEACDILALLFRWGHDPDISRMRNVIFLCCAKPGELHADLRSVNSGIRFINIPLPNQEERLEYIEGYLERRKNLKEGNELKPKPIPLLGMDVVGFAAASAGVNLRHIESFMLSGYKSVPSGVTMELVQSMKQRIITAEYSKMASILRPLPGGFSSMGGNRDIVQWAEKKIIGPIRRGSRRAPKGILLVGPPGTGKTMFAQALAAEIGFSALILKASTFLNKYVGESERRLTEFFDFAKALAPVLIFVDEIDQGPMGRRGGAEDPVAGNIFNEMLTFIGDESLRGKVLMLFATNMPQLLDDALLRPGRIDFTYPFLLPDEEARQSIFRVQAKSQGYPITEEAVLYAASDKSSKNYSPADIMSIVIEALDVMEENGRKEIGLEDMKIALQYIKPKTPETADLYTRRAIAACSSNRFLQEREAKMLENRPALTASIVRGEKAVMPYDREEREV